MKRIMAIDYGDARIGIALTDPLQIISSGFKTIPNNKESYDTIYNICIEKDVESIVVGIPFDQNSKIGDAAKKVLSFVKNLQNYFKQKQFELPFYEEDERYSTRDALEAMREMKVKNNKKKELVDTIAAANILSSFMRNRQKIKLELDKYK
ncbi:MAG: hypothetical protein A2086_07515 [Spirochaetes bacterium GWD1_27_9]|nr:MAG: hypothetical protein A2Z98_18160 [Spirochaetes bacterium GWB1_27_13]OHD27954.1 MAG: hypothetical protein A2Y34_13350 [Spirochaetes bacterium GWC1_27_15]OHD44780.1 MAG: hypothetical protein A2086_07515 [Spirochaetes bacterium GWD1_27_9]